MYWENVEVAIIETWLIRNRVHWLPACAHFLRKRSQKQFLFSWSFISCWRDESKHIKIKVTLLYLKWTTNKVLSYKHRCLLCSLLCGSLDGKGVWERMDPCICMVESPCSSPETITALVTGFVCAKPPQLCRLFAILWTVARQAPLSMGFSRQEYRSWLPCLPPGDLPDPGIKPASLMSPAFLAGRFFSTIATWEDPLIGYTPTQSKKSF